ncbi:MAG: flavin reductase family protein [Rhizobiales bacterium]|nr:flavin reductase family protein [Hyphomicrobiales bacterium]
MTAVAAPLCHNPGSESVQTDNEGAEFPAQFRAAMGQLGGGVSIITVGRGNDRSGLTSNSVTSLSLDPPSLLVCVNRQSSSWPLIHRYRAFGVNVLAPQHQPVAETFSGKSGLKGNERYAGSQWFELATGAPLLADAIAAIDCEVEEMIDRHSHSIVIGRVRAIRHSPAARGLIYWRGRYLPLTSSHSNSR